MKKFNVCVVGVGAVGQEMIRLLRKRNFPAESIVILARSAREEIIDGESYQVKETSAEAFDRCVATAASWSGGIVASCVVPNIRRRASAWPRLRPTLQMCFWASLASPATGSRQASVARRLRPEDVAAAPAR